jgi:hypothetical protein
MEDKGIYTLYVRMLANNLILQPHNHLVQEGNCWYFNPATEHVDSPVDSSQKALHANHPEFQQMTQALLKDLLNPDLGTHCYQYYFGKNNQHKIILDSDPSPSQLSHLYRTLGMDENWHYIILNQIQSDKLYQSFITEPLAKTQIKYANGHFEKRTISPLSALVLRINHLNTHQAFKVLNYSEIFSQDEVLTMLVQMMENNQHLLEDCNVMGFELLVAIKRVLNKENMPQFLDNFKTLTGLNPQSTLCHKLSLVTHTIEINYDYLALNYQIETRANLVNIFNLMEKVFMLPEVSSMLGLHHFDLAKNVTGETQTIYVQTRLAEDFDMPLFSQLIHDFIDTAIQYPLNGFPVYNEKITAQFLKKALGIKLNNELPIQEETNIFKMKI